MKLRGRLALTVGLTLAPLALGVAALQAHLRRQALAEGLVEAARSRLDERARRRCEADPRHWPGRRVRRRPRLRVVPLDERFRSPRPHAPHPPEELMERVRSGAPWSYQVAATPHRRHDRLLVLLRTPWARGPCAHLLIVRPVGPSMQALGGPSLTAALAVSGAAVLLVLLAAGPLVARIRRLTAWSRRARHAPTPPPERGGDELGELASAFESLLAAMRHRARQAEHREEALRGYVRATHHDLAVPLTALRAHLERIETDCEQGSPPDRATLADALAEADYLGTLLHNLATAARLHGETRLETHPVDLREVLLQVLGRLAPLARRRGLRLERALPTSSLCTEVDRILLERAWGNLLHNALRHARSQVAVVLDLRPEGFELRILDDGPGADPARLEEHARRPLYEQRPSRGRAEGGGGLGLGLRIAWHVASIHGHALRFEPAEPAAGLLVRWEGPCQSRRAPPRETPDQLRPGRTSERASDHTAAPHASTVSSSSHAADTYQSTAGGSMRSAIGVSMPEKKLCGEAPASIRP